jgi:hypothetical protein
MTDDIAKAVALQKKLAASLMVRRDDLELALKARGDSPELRAELEEVKAELAIALTEIKQLQKLAGDAKIAEAKGDLLAHDDTDPFIRTPEDIALENVREHARSLEAQVKVNDELGGAPEAPATPSKEDADAKARAEFEALRAGGGKRPKTF